MTLNWVCLILVAALGLYLFAALLKPEWFG